MKYVEEEVSFANGAVRLAGTLTLPDNPSGCPAVVLLQGSGPLDRNEEVFGFRPFAVIADYLARNGIAVLRYDSRGVEVQAESPSSTHFQMLPEMPLPPLIT